MILFVRKNVGISYCHYSYYNFCSCDGMCFFYLSAILSRLSAYIHNKCTPLHNGNEIDREFYCSSDILNIGPHTPREEGREQGKDKTEL